jgi:hypothetical protein
VARRYLERASGPTSRPPQAAAERALVMRHRQQEVRPLPLRGLHGGVLPFVAYAELMRQEARARDRRRPAGRVA